MIIRTCPNCFEAHILIHHTRNVELVLQWHRQTDAHIRMCKVIKILEGVVCGKS